jgi:hypothetical protein
LPMVATLVVSAVLFLSSPASSGQVHLRRRPGGDRGRPVADLRSLLLRDDLPGRPTRATPDRPRRRASRSRRRPTPSLARPPGRLWHGVGDQRRGAPGRSGARGGSHRQCGSTRYRDHMRIALEGRHLPASVTDAILGSLGGALGVAHAAVAPRASCWLASHVRRS